MNQNGLHQIPTFYTTYVQRIKYEENPYSANCQPLTPDSTWKHRIAFLMTQMAYGMRLIESLESGIRPLFVTSLLWGETVAADIDAYILRFRKKVKLLGQLAKTLVDQDLQHQPPTLKQAETLAYTHSDTFEADRPCTEAATTLVMHHFRIHVNPSFRFKNTKAYQPLPPFPAGRAKSIIQNETTHVMQPGNRKLYLDPGFTSMPDSLEEIYRRPPSPRTKYVEQCVVKSANQEAKRLLQEPKRLFTAQTLLDEAKTWWKGTMFPSIPSCQQYPDWPNVTGPFRTVATHLQRSPQTEKATGEQNNVGAAPLIAPIYSLPPPPSSGQLPSGGRNNKGSSTNMRSAHDIAPPITVSKEKKTAQGAVPRRMHFIRPKGARKRISLPNQSAHTRLSKPGGQHQKNPELTL